MILPDLNLLLYAYNPFAHHHRKAAAWWQDAMAADELIGLPHEILFGFVRIATHPRIGEAAVDVDAASSVVGCWLELPQSRILTPGPDHLERTMRLMIDSGSRGPVLSDAVLAAHALANRATLCSNDGDFARFSGLDWRNPLVE